MLPVAESNGFHTGNQESFVKVVEIESGETSARKKTNLVLEIPNKEISNVHVQENEYVKINMPAAAPTPRRVNFLLTPGSADSREKLSPAQTPSSSRLKPPFKNLLPKLSFKNRGLSSDVDNGGQGEVSSSRGVIDLSISRSLSLMFSPKFKRAVSMPVAHVAQSSVQTRHEGSESDSMNSNVTEFHSSE